MCVCLDSVYSGFVLSMVCISASWNIYIHMAANYLLMFINQLICFACVRIWLVFFLNFWCDIEFTNEWQTQNTSGTWSVEYESRTQIQMMCVEGGRWCVCVTVGRLRSSERVRERERHTQRERLWAHLTTVCESH